jgi:hypothetical protein
LVVSADKSSSGIAGVPKEIVLRYQDKNVAMVKPGRDSGKAPQIRVLGVGKSLLDPRSLTININASGRWNSDGYLLPKADVIGTFICNSSGGVLPFSEHSRR